MSGVLNDCDAILQAAPVRVIVNALVAQVQGALDAAAAAQDDADTAILVLADIASDGKLTPGEKPDVVAKRDIIIAEQAGIEAQPTALGVTTEKTAYTAAIAALTAYLASTPLTGWSTIPGSTINITGTELRGKFGDVYAKKQALLNAISAATATRAVWASISGTGKPEDGATVGAPAGTLVNGVPVASITNAVTNFNAGNDRNSAALAIPTVLGDGSAVDHTIRKDGAADVSFEWAWAGSEGDIDGFLVYVYQTTSSLGYTFGSTPAQETVYTVPASKRAFILFGAAADLYVTFGVMAYRSVDKDVNVTGVIKSPLVKPGLAAENPYRPSASVAFAGDITGTVNGTAVATVLADLIAAKAAADAANAAITAISSDGIVSTGEKSELILKWNEINNEKGGIDAAATALGVTTEKTTYGTAYTALFTYLQAMNPVWNNLTQNTTLTAEGALSAGDTFRKKFSDVYAAKQALLNAIAAKSATVAQYDNVSGRPDVYRVVTEGGSNTAALPVPAGFYINGTLYAGVMRSYTLVSILRSTHAIVHNQTYDVWGSGASTAGRNAGSLANELNWLADRPGQYIVIVYSSDEPFNNRLTSNLPAAMYRNGASSAVFGSPKFMGRAAYALISVSGCGEGNGSEAYQGSVADDANAWIDVVFSLSKGNLVGVGAAYTPRSLQDYSFTGDLNATAGAPVGTNVAGVPAETVASQAGNAVAAKPGFALNAYFDPDISGPGGGTLTATFSVNPTGYTGSYSVRWTLTRLSGGPSTQGPFLNSASDNTVSASATANSGTIRYEVSVTVTHSGGLTASATSGARSLTFGSA